MPSIEDLSRKPGLEHLSQFGAEQQSDEVLISLEQRYADSQANRASAGYLWATGCPLFYPYGEKAENYNRVATADPLLNDPEVLQYVLDRYQSNPEDSRVARLAATAVQTNISLYLTPFDGEAAKDRESREGFWEREIAGLPNGDYILETVAAEKGGNLWQQYSQIRNRVTSGALSPEEAAPLVPIFDAVERAAGKHEARQLVRAVGKLQELGFTSIDSYFELILGEPVEDVQEKAQTVVDQFKDGIDRSGQPKDYFEYFASLMKGFDNEEFPADMDEAILQVVESLGITREEWEAAIVTCYNGVSEIPTAYYYLFPGEPDFPQRLGLEPATQEWPNRYVWDKIRQGARAGIVMRGGAAQSSEHVRLTYHENGHAIEALLRILLDRAEGAPAGASLMGRPMTISEVFSLFNESNMPDQQFFKRKEGFLTHRYAALLMHEVNLWRAAEMVTNEAQMEQFLTNAERSYQETMGDALHLKVSTGRAFRDFFDPRSPFIAASYAFGMPLALEVKSQLAGLTKPSERRALLERVSAATARGRSVNDVVEALGRSWQSVAQTVQALSS